MLKSMMASIDDDAAAADGAAAVALRNKLGYALYLTVVRRFCAVLWAGSRGMARLITGL